MASKTEARPSVWISGAHAPAGHLCAWTNSRVRSLGYGEAPVEGLEQGPA